MGDPPGSVAAIAAALFVLREGRTPIDPILIVPFTLLIARAACAAVRGGGHIPLERAPARFDARAVADGLAALPGAAEADHVQA